MSIPFTLQDFLELFRQYNERIALAPFVLSAMGATIAALAFAKVPWRHRMIAAALAALWLWSGFVYHWVFFTRINPAAWIFGAAFIAQGLWLAAHGVVRQRLLFAPRGAASIAGILLIAYALVAYPALGAALGHGYPNGPSFGAPCPVTIFYFGMMLLACETVSVRALVVPLLWSVVATSAAIQLGMREDLMLSVAAAAVVADYVRRRRAHRSTLSHANAPRVQHGF